MEKVRYCWNPIKLLPINIKYVISLRVDQIKSVQRKKSNHDTAQSNTNTTNQISPNNNPIGISILQPDIVKLIVQASFVTRIAAACIYATIYISTMKDKTDKVARTK